MAPKHIPLRTCVQCRQVRGKRELVRIVRSPQGTIEIDERGKNAGRGAYLCRNRCCWENALSGERLDHALNTRISATDRQRLAQYGQQLPAVCPGGKAVRPGDAVAANGGDHGVVQEEPIGEEKGERAATTAES